MGDLSQMTKGLDSHGCGFMSPLKHMGLNPFETKVYRVADTMASVRTHPEHWKHISSWEEVPSTSYLSDAYFYQVR